MALVVEDGTGKADAQSYVSVADAATLLGARIDTDKSDGWDNADTPEKERALALAADRIDSENVGRFGSSRSILTQALSFPRLAFRDADERLYDQDVIPDHLKLATAFRAESIRAGDEAQDRTTGGSLESLKVDVITLDFAAGASSTA